MFKTIKNHDVIFRCSYCKRQYISDDYIIENHRSWVSLYTKCSHCGHKNWIENAPYEEDKSNEKENKK